MDHDVTGQVADQRQAWPQDEHGAEGGEHHAEDDQRSTERLQSIHVRLPAFAVERRQADGRSSQSAGMSGSPRRGGGIS